MIISPYIEYAVAIALSTGYSVENVSTGWSKMNQVIEMSGRLSSELRQSIEDKVPSLRYWSTEGTPHNAPQEGFTCDEYQVSIFFYKTPVSK